MIDTTKANYGAAIAPQDLGDGKSYQDMLEVPRALGLVAKRSGTWEMNPLGTAKVLPVPELPVSAVIDYQEEAIWTDKEPVPPIEYRYGTYPTTTLRGVNPVPVPVSVEGLVNLADAKLRYYTQSKLFNNDSPLVCYTCHIDNVVFSLLNKIGEIIRLPATTEHSPVSAILHTVELDSENNIATLKFVRL